MRRKIGYFIYAAVLLSAVLFFTAVLLLPNQTDKIILPKPITLLGEYSVDGGPFTALTKDTDFDTNSRHTTVIRGHFSEDIPEGEGLLLYIRNLYITLKLDGRVVYQFGDPKEEYFFRTPGITFAEVQAGSVTKDTAVELIITDAFCNTLPSIPDLLDRLSVGHRAQLYQKLIQVDGLLIFGSIFSSALGVLALLLALVSRLMGTPYAAKSAALGFFALIAGMWFLYSMDNSFLPLIIPLPRFAAANDIFCLYAMSLAGITLVHTFVGREYQRYSIIPVRLNYAGQGILLVLQLLGAVQLYEVQATAMLFTLLAVVNYVILAVGVARNKDPEARLASVCLIPAALSGLVECVNYFLLPAPVIRAYIISTVGFAATFCMLLIFIVYQMKQSNDMILRTNVLEKELAESRIAIMLSQIQPHFLYNALNTIHYLCRTQPQKAAEVIEDFAAYLRGNMDSLTQEGLISFEQELGHLKNYLSIEKLRFPNVEITYHLQTQKFWLPMLTLQPLVENAIRYGVTQCEREGVVTVSTWENESFWYLQVEDNGAGFDPAKIKEDGRSHIGISNVRKRLEALCKGTLSIASTPGKGTCVTIAIPKEGKIEGYNGRR